MGASKGRGALSPPRGSTVGFWSRVLLLTMSAPLVAGCASLIGEENPGKRTVGTWLDDQYLESRAKANIKKANEGFRNANIDVTSFNGLVLLTGQVPNDRLKTLASDAASALAHAKRITNELVVSEPQGFLARRSDDLLANKVWSELKFAKDVDVSRMNIVVEAGVVYLMGLLTRDEANSAVNQLRALDGVERIVKVFEYIEREPL